jgi:hypothetical protein
MYAEASECFERLLAEDPNDHVALERAASCDLARGREDKSLHTRGVRRAKEALQRGAPGAYVAWRNGEYRD